MVVNNGEGDEDNKLLSNNFKIKIRRPVIQSICSGYTQQDKETSRRWE